MNITQSPHVPAHGSRPSLGDLRWLLPFAVRGFAELVRARFAFSGLQASEIPVRNKVARDKAGSGQSIPPATLARIAYVLPRISDRLPWRSDCLIQAIAAQNWLSALGSASEIQIGVENPEGGQFGAHAWLKHADEVITGGDISKYAVLLADSRFAGDSNDQGDQVDPG